MRDGTLCLLIRGDPPEQVLLGLKKQGFGPGKWGGFGGKIETGETATGAAIRELEEEAGVRIAEGSLQLLGLLTFVFPAKPAWNQVVYVFVATEWEGTPVESTEMDPAWFAINDIHYDQMWQDGIHWLPRILAGERILGHFTFKDDNETVDEVEIKAWDGSTLDQAEEKLGVLAPVKGTDLKSVEEGE
jgi:8-oxo-dGTP pyrophosphatase MutT (NUDIX family)